MKEQMKENEDILMESQNLIIDSQSRECINIDKDSVQKRNLTWNGLHLPYNSNNVNYARKMRREMTPAESKLWYGFLRTF